MLIEGFPMVSKSIVEGAMGLSNGTKSMVSLATRMLDHELQKS
jgi:hypothetical protein